MDVLQRILLYASWLTAEIDICDDEAAKFVLEQVLNQYLTLFEDYIQEEENEEE
jgi:hypothetical protein